MKINSSASSLQLLTHFHFSDRSWWTWRYRGWQLVIVALYGRHASHCSRYFSLHHHLCRCRHL